MITSEFRFLASGLTFAASLLISAQSLAADPPPKPLLRDFIGLNTHTIQFKPVLYRPVTRHVRDYHPFSWDVGDDTNFATTFPFARNRVDWSGVYGSWKQAGYISDVSLMFDDTPPAKWKDLARDSRAYAAAFARYFGPSGERKLVESVEIGNEPGKYDDAAYRTLFESASRGFREGDPALKIATCNVLAKPSGDYHKSLDAIKGLEPLYDVISTHSYAFAEQYPTWRRSYPEDPNIDFFKDIAGVIAWRNANAPGKPVWLTEFGWDATTQTNEKEGTFKDWVGVTDEQQAQYLVRSLLVLSELDLGRAYIYFFNDEDKPSLHASSGLTRNFRPKPSFHAVAHLFATLGNYRFSRAVTKSAGDLYVYEFSRSDGSSQRLWALWSPTGSGRTMPVSIRLPPKAKIVQAERMPLSDAAVELVKWSVSEGGIIELEAGESPVYLWLQ